MKSVYEVVVPTKGENITGLLAGLVQWAPFPLRLLTERIPTSTHDLQLLDTLAHLGCDITLQKQSGGIGNARALFVPSHYEVLVVLDDDVVVQLAWRQQHEGYHPFSMLAEAAKLHPFAIGIIRFAQNFRDAPPGHEEVWEEVSENDPRVARAAAARGVGWANRVYDFGRDIEGIDQLAGACFAVTAERFAAIAPQLRGWRAGGGDYYIGRKLGPGVVLSGVYAYHFGWWSQQKWGFNDVAQKILYREPETYRRYARGDLRAKP